MLVVKIILKLLIQCLAFKHKENCKRNRFIFILGLGLLGLHDNNVMGWVSWRMDIYFLTDPETPCQILAGFCLVWAVFLPGRPLPLAVLSPEETGREKRGTDTHREWAPGVPAKDINAIKSEPPSYELLFFVTFLIHGAKSQTLPT